MHLMPMYEMDGSDSDSSEGEGEGEEGEGEGGEEESRPSMDTEAVFTVVNLNLYRT